MTGKKRRTILVLHMTSFSCDRLAFSENLAMSNVQCDFLEGYEAPEELSRQILLLFEQ